jgi:ABC-type multidrug transport system ATPase subunit
VCIINRGHVVAFGSPASVKAQLVQEYVLVDAEHRDRLRAELQGQGMAYSGDGPFQVSLAGHTVHEVARAIETPLSRLETHIPTLEDAYLDVIGRS